MYLPAVWETGFEPWVRKIPGEGNDYTLYFLFVCLFCFLLYLVICYMWVLCVCVCVCVCVCTLFAICESVSV